VPHEDVVAFLERYSFHEHSEDGNRQRLVDYIGKRSREGALQRWSVAVIGNSQPGSTTARCSFGHGVDIRMVKRARLGQGSETTLDPVADIKTLSSRRDETIDLDTNGHDVGSRQRILDLRRAQRPDEGLLLVYPIEPESDTGKGGRLPLNAPTNDVVIGVALLFPTPRPGSSDSEIEYYSADLSGVRVEVEDTSVLDYDDDEAA
jgi:hypothetical protein